MKTCLTEQVEIIQYVGSYLLYTDRYLYYQNRRNVFYESEVWKLPRFLV